MSTTVTPRRRRRHTIRRAVVAVCALAAAAPAAATAAPEASPDYVKGYRLGSEAYVYGVPLLDMEKTFATQTSVSVADTRGNGPVNHFNHLRSLADPLDRTVVAPNQDTMYSVAWFDLSREPMVVHTPRADRFHVLPLYTPYQENIATIGSPKSVLPDGDYVLTPPGWQGRLPRGVRRIRAPYDRLWAIVRIVVFNKADERKVNRIQDDYSVTPLSEWGKNVRKTRRPGKADTTVDKATIPGTAPGEDPLKFYDALGDALVRFPPPAADEPELAQLAEVGVGPGLHPSTAGLSAAMLHGLRDGVAYGRQRVDDYKKRIFVQSFPQHNGWLVTRTGNYGTDYEKRAVVDLIGLGALRSDVAVYPYAQTDNTLQALTGAKRYVVHFPPADAHPPADAFWSLTLYDTAQFFVPNPINRYVLNDRSGLKYNPDGSLDIYLQHDKPTDPGQVSNWLPAPTSGFNLLFRLYEPSPAKLGGILDGSGWKPGSILACLPTGTSATGVPCAK